MQEIPRAILLPPPLPPNQRVRTQAVRIDSDSTIDAARSAPRSPQTPAGNTGSSFLTLIDTRREDTVEIKGKQFRFRPYGSRGAGADTSTHATGPADETGDTEALDAATDDISVDLLDGFGAGANERNSSAFIASFIAQERLRQGLYNPQYEAASDAYRRAGGSPSAIDNQPRVVSFAV